MKYVSIPTPHISLKDKNLVAKTVLMPGDPLRAKHVAQTYLEDVVQINGVRNMLGFTGTYKGKKVSVFGSGMGMPSIGIYAWELFEFYDVENIIRIGSAGAYSMDLDLYDVVLADSAVSLSNYARTMGLDVGEVILPSQELNDKLRRAAKRLGVILHEGPVHSSDNFYYKDLSQANALVKRHNAYCVEMESYALFANAQALGKNGACILTISDHLVTHAVTTSEERQKSFHQMMEVALESLFE